MEKGKNSIKVGDIVEGILPSDEGEKFVGVVLEINFGLNKEVYKIQYMEPDHKVGNVNGVHILRILNKKFYERKYYFKK